jgi:hypothetical protein
LPRCLPFTAQVVQDLHSLGYRYRGTPTIVALGPLADEYDRLLRDAGLVPPIRTLQLAGEALLEYIGSRRFDIAYPVNSLDHSADPSCSG